MRQLPDALRGRFPVLCRLREWAGIPDCLAGNGRWTRAQLEDSLSLWLDKTQPGGLMAAVFREELAAGRCLLILDGVDEVPESIPGGHLPRRNLITGLVDALPQWLKAPSPLTPLPKGRGEAGNRVLLTSRPYGLCDDDRRKLNLPQAELAELPESLQNSFVRRWYAAADPSKATEKAAGLLGHLQERQDLAELRRNPMLLTALCVMYDNGQRLPQDYYRLYDAVVGQVLHKRYETENLRDLARFRLEAIALGMHRGLKDERPTPNPEVDTDEIDRHLAESSKRDVVTESGAIDAASRREDLLSNSGLLLPRSGGKAGFYHLSFQEFLAAVRLRRIGEKPEALLKRHAATPAWHRTLRFLFCAIADKDSPEAAIDGFASLLAHLEPERLEQDPDPALLLVDCLEVAHGRGWNLDRFAGPLKQACGHALDHLPPPPRAHLWRALGRLGLDGRPGVGLKDGVPDIDWVEIKAGPFRYGDKKEKRSLPAFHISRYPVTNAQFQAFSDDQGYQTQDWWQDLAGHPEPERGRWNDPNHPRETVSWFEAVAYCRWLSAKLGYAVRLPTDEEWEKAARGGDGREYPWGEGYESGRANINETWGNAGPFYLGQTSPVGIYPTGESPCGALDMVGNVWEWCLNRRDRPDDLDVAGRDSRVLRGGSWFDNPHFARASYRHYFVPDDRDDDIGFRLVCSRPIPGL